jgi:UDP-2-acetamido-3-amino-2,3-dideoxy-glucuronate N-acetyltransferase
MPAYNLAPVPTETGAYLAHPSAYISPDAVIGNGAKIHPGAIIGDGTVLGEGSLVGPYARVEGAELGAGAAVWDHTSVRPGAKLGEGAGMGHASIVNTNVQVGDHTRIQNQVSVPEGITIADSVFIGPGAKFPNDRHPRAFGPWLIGETQIDFGASIGGNATVVCGEEGHPMRVGAFATLAAGSVATKEMLPFGLYVGNEQVGWVDPVGNTVSHDPDTVPTYERITQDLTANLQGDHRVDEARAARIVQEVDAAYGRLAA